MTLHGMFKVFFTSCQGQLTKAESIFNMMKETACFCDVITYTSMIHAYSSAGIFFLQDEDSKFLMEIYSKYDLAIV